jgi:hypothetical protein
MNNSYRTPLRASIGGSNTYSSERVPSSISKNHVISNIRHGNTSTTPNHPSSAQIEQLFRTPNVERYQEQYDLVEKNSPVNATGSMDLKRVWIEADAGSTNTKSNFQSKKSVLPDSDADSKENERKKLLSMVETLFDDDDDVKTIPTANKIANRNGSTAPHLKEDNQGTTTKPSVPTSLFDESPKLEPHFLSTAQNRWNDQPIAQNNPSSCDSELLNSDKIVFEYESDKETPAYSNQSVNASSSFTNEDNVFPSSILTKEFFQKNNIPILDDTTFSSSAFTDKGLPNSNSKSNKAGNLAFEERYHQLLSSLLTEVEKFGINEVSGDPFAALHNFNSMKTVPSQPSASSFSLSLQQELFSEEIQNHLNILRKVSKRHSLSRDSDDVAGKLQKFLLLPVEHLQQLALKQVCVYACLLLFISFFSHHKLISISSDLFPEDDKKKCSTAFIELEKLSESY